jgi:hypothetical protein
VIRVHPFLRILVNFGVTASILVLVAGAFQIFVPKYRTMRGFENRCNSLRGRVESKQDEIHQIRENQGRLHRDSDFVARIAHMNRRVFPNELMFVFDER